MSSPAPQTPAPLARGLAAVGRLRVLNLRETRTHQLRLITSLLVIAVSSLLLVAVLSTYGSITDSVSRLSATIAGDADLDVGAIGDAGVDASLVGEIRRGVPQASTVAPLVRSSATLGTGSDRVAVLGADTSVLGLGGALRSVLASGSGGSTTRFDPATSVAVGPGLGLSVGDRIRVGGVPVTVAEVVRSDAARPIASGRFIAAFLPLAQRITGESGRVDSVLVAAAPGVSTDDLRARVEAVVEGRAVVNDPDYRAAQVATASAVTRDSTLLVALISVVIAAFLVFNTMTMAVASRRPVLAMVRAIGGRRGPLVRDLIGEAAVIGALGGLIGVPLGMLAGRWIIGRLPSANIDSVSATVTYSVAWYAPVVALVACVAACAAASLLAARSVLRLSPVEAMSPVQSDEQSRGSTRLEIAAGAAGLGAIAVGWVIAYTVTGRAVFSAAVLSSIGGLLVFFALTRPIVAAIVGLARRIGGPGQLAAVTAERTPRRVWTTAMTVAVAVSVGIGTSGAMNDLIGSVSGALDGVGDPDLYVSTQPVSDIPAGPVLDPAVREAVSTVPGVSRVVGGQWAYLNLGAARVVVQGLTPGVQSPFVKRASPQVVRQAIAGDGIVLSKVLSATVGKGVGDEVRLATPVGYRTLRVLQVVDYPAIESGTAAMSFDLLQQWFQRSGDTFLQVTIAPGADPAQVRTAVTRAAQGAVVGQAGAVRPYVYTGPETLDATRASVEQSGSFTIAIQWIVALVAAVALLNTLLLSVIERRREIGVLRAMGASRRFASRMVVAEAAAIAGVGAVLGVASGELLHAVSDQVLGVTTAVSIDYRPQLFTVVYVVAAFVLCVVGAVVPALRAGRLTIVDAIADE
ncbi:FtsX-like permease family protein [Williamsia deligens]|uniref:FtsX-like permease family protein n=1 Tax=Williamsia deligens TaxID=321325 RepID=A0ABW3G443_9NOCA|nr:FtsX-like permease family protein [Williamsia deligens]MCP2194467.1 putative ABC transport system permease protein [Williamsia deligens]